MQKGDIVLVPFPFVEVESSKVRPALVLNKPIRKNIIVAFITTNLSKADENYELKLHPDKTNRLKEISMVRLDKLATFETNLIRARLGRVDKNSLDSLDSKLISLFDLRKPEQSEGRER